jgi:hypothetical protein
MPIEGSSGSHEAGWHISAMWAPTLGPWTRSTENASMIPSPVQTIHVLGPDERGGIL